MARRCFTGTSTRSTCRSFPRRRTPPPPPPTPAPPPAPPPPSGNALLSSTRACKNQAFRFKNHLFGFQYHFEMDEAGIEALLASCGEDATKVLGPDGPDKIRQD